MKSKVLVIDDSIDMQELVAIHLRQESIETIRAFSGGEALSLARTRKPAAILLDLDLGAENGLEVCRTLQDDAETHVIPIIILTGTMDSPVKLKAFALGAVDYVIKPFAGGDLRTRVRTALRLRRYAELLAEHADLDAESELFMRRALDREVAGDLLLLSLHDHSRLLACYGRPFCNSAIRVLADGVRAVVEPRRCFLYAPGVVAVLSTDLPLLDAVQASLKTIFLAHAGASVEVLVQSERRKL